MTARSISSSPTRWKAREKAAASHRAGRVAAGDREDVGKGDASGKAGQGPDQPKADMGQPKADNNEPKADKKKRPKRRRRKKNKD